MKNLPSAEEAYLPPLNQDLQDILHVISDPRRCERLKSCGIHLEISEADPSLYSAEHADP